MTLRFLSSFSSCLIRLQFFFVVYRAFTSGSNSQHLRRSDFDVSSEILILPPRSPSLPRVTQFSLISRPTFFPFSTRRFFRLAIQFEMQRRSSEHSRLNPESCCRRLIPDSPRHFSSVTSLSRLTSIIDETAIGKSDDSVRMTLTLN